MEFLISSTSDRCQYTSIRIMMPFPLEFQRWGGAFCLALLSLSLLCTEVLSLLLASASSCMVCTVKRAGRCCSLEACIPLAAINCSSHPIWAAWGETKDLFLSHSLLLTRNIRQHALSKTSHWMLKWNIVANIKNPIRVIVSPEEAGLTPHIFGSISVVIMVI